MKLFIVEIHVKLQLKFYHVIKVVQNVVILELKVNIIVLNVIKDIIFLQIFIVLIVILIQMKKKINGMFLKKEIL